MARAGLRRTQATQAVLALLSGEPHWHPTHAEVLERLQAQGLAVNRVTLYRLLDRLAQAGLLRRRSDETGRVWRYAWANDTQQEQAPRFECDACHRQYPLPQASAPTQAVTDELMRTLVRLGHHGERLELAIHGTCAGCSSPA